MHSSTAPRFIFQNGWYDSMPPGKQTWLTVRNDDLYYLRWGDPDFVRRYWTQLPQPEKIAGFMIGPDGYTWGRDFVSTRPSTPRRLVIEKQWYWFMLWGRLAYEPAMSDEPFQAALEARFPRAGGLLYASLSSASRILPLVNRFYWGYFDFMWYPEASWSQAGFVGVRDFITPKFPPMREDEDGEPLRIMSVKAFVDRGSQAGHITPLEVASELDTLAADGVLRLARSVPVSDRSRAPGDCRRHPRDGRARPLLRRQDPRRRRARALREDAGRGGARPGADGAPGVRGALARVRAAVERAERRQRLHAARPDAGRHDGDPGGGGEGHPGAASCRRIGTLNPPRHRLRVASTSRARVRSPVQEMRRGASR